MTSSTIVNSLGMLAGAVWLCGAIYFQLIREGRTRPGFVTLLTCIGIALMMASSAIAFDGRPPVVETLAILANLLFLCLGVAASLVIEWVTKTREAQSRTENYHNH